MTTYVLIESALFYSAIASLATFAIGFALGFRWRADRKPRRREMRVERKPHFKTAFGEPYGSKNPDSKK